MNTNITKFISLQKINENEYKTKNDVIINIVENEGLKSINWKNSPVNAITSQPLNRCRITNMSGIGYCLVIDNVFYDNNKNNRELLANKNDEMIIQYDYLFHEAIKPDLLNL